MVDGFDNREIMNMYMSNRHSNLVFDTSIQYDNGSFGVCQSIENNFIEFLKMCLSSFSILPVGKVKGKATREQIN